MDKKLYVFKKISSEDTVNHLIALLHKDDSGIWLESRLDDRESSQSYSIPVLEIKPEPKCEHTASIRKWLEAFWPPAENKAFMKTLMEKSGMKQYDEWEWLKRFTPESKSIISFSDTFPINYMRHDLKLLCIDKDDEENFLYHQDYTDAKDMEPLNKLISYDKWLGMNSANASEDCDFSFMEHNFDEILYDDEDEEDEEYEEYNEDEDDRMLCAELKVYDENTGLPSLFDFDKEEISSEQTQINLKEFSKSQDRCLVTNKTVIRKTFEALADIPLSVYFKGIGESASYISNLSKMAGISDEKMRDFTVYDVIKAFSPYIRTNEDIPDQYNNTAASVYRIISMPIGKAIFNKPIRI